MKLAIKVLSLSLFFFTISLSQSQAQKIKVYEGKFKALKGEKIINVAYDYSNTSVGKFDVEQDYLDEKVQEKNEDEAGTGDSWLIKWNADREERFEPKFEELMNEYLNKEGIKVGKYPDAKYTLILKTTHTEPGWNVGVMRRSAHINADIWLVETGTDKAEAKMELKKVPGRDAWGFDFDTGYRLQEAYAKCGKSLAKYLTKKAVFRHDCWI